MDIRPFFVILAWVMSAGAAHAVPQAALDSAAKPDRGQYATQRPAIAQKITAPTVAFKELEGEARREAVAKVEAYLSTLSSIVANFSQISADGSMGAGKFFLKRPGKMRWQYNPPTPLLLVSDGKSMTYYDPGLDQVTYIGVDDTLAGFLAQKVIKLDSASTRLTALAAGEGMISATIVQAKKPDEGSLTLEFSAQPLKIRNLIAVDATGNETRVTLENAQFGPVLDDKLFVFVDPRGVNDRRNRK